ncbi:MAG: MBL fold metallo-hydrolase [Bacteroidetes bacterium]|nr:MAG: MBL fold metallo-hydrolase [Bacteroidota bacterium]
MKITILGSGTSQGVPVIACECHSCTSNDPKDKRTRVSVLIEYQGENFVIDAGPDFRQQMLREKVKSLRAIMLTHEHKDHISGLDDVRAFNFKEKRPMEIFCSEQVQTALHREYHYVFMKDRYPGVPSFEIQLVDREQFQLPDGPQVTPIEVMHYKMPVKGFRIDDFTYITDAKTVSLEEREKIKGSKVLIINCLHEKEHISHFNLEEALQFIEDMQPERAYLTHISHYFGRHEEILEKLPEGVLPCYDGMTIEM